MSRQRWRHCQPGKVGSIPTRWRCRFESGYGDNECCDDIATENKEDMSIDIATITCPSCGADADSLCFYPGVAFCMECGDVFDLAEKREAQKKEK
jgi:hypothetical protein